MANADGAGLVSAAVRAAILAKAPRRTVSAVAAAVVSAVVGAHAKAACQTPMSSERAGTQRGTARSNDDDAAGCPAALLEALRAARASQRKRKKERRRAAKTAASTVVDEKGAQTQATLDPGGGPCQPASSAHVVNERDPQNPPRKKARDGSCTMAVVPSVEQPTSACGDSRGGVEQTQDVSAGPSHLDAAAAYFSALKLKMAHTDKCGNVTNVEGPTATVRKIMDVVNWRFQQEKRAGRRTRARPADKLPERLVYTDNLGRTVLEGRACTVREVAGLINSWPGSLDHSWCETPS